MVWQDWLVGLCVNVGLVAVALLAPKKLLTPLGYLNAWVLGVLLWGTLGWQPYVITMAYFLVGSAVTKIGFAQKQAAGIAEKRDGVRGPGNVWGSALTAALCTVLILGLRLVHSPALATWEPLLVLGLVASLCTKLSDTCASEIGKAYGQRTFLITTLQPVPRGTEGAVSLEGTLAGVVASLGLALLGWLIGLIPLLGVLWCMIAAFVATNIESLIGATIETKLPGLNADQAHDLVNIVNTLIGAVVAIALSYFIQPYFLQP
jgi:uncharacterized protein (TIGR00297 family)